MEDQRRSRLALKLFRKAPLTKKAQRSSQRIPYLGSYSAEGDFIPPAQIAPLFNVPGRVPNLGATSAEGKYIPPARKGDYQRPSTTGRRDPFRFSFGRTGGATIKYAPGLSEEQKGLIDVTFRNAMDREAQDRAAARKAGRPPRSAQGIAAAKEIQARVDAARKARRPLRSAQGTGIETSAAGFSKMTKASPAQRTPRPYGEIAANYVPKGRTTSPAAPTSQAQAFKVQGGQGYAHLARNINKKFGFKGDKRVSGRDLFKRMGGQILSAKRSYNFRQSDFGGAGGSLPSLAGAGGLGEKGIARSAALRKRLVAKGAFGKKPTPKSVVNRPPPKLYPKPTPKSLIWGEMPGVMSRLPAMRGPS